MKQPTDRDGKSKTASAIDAGRYPEQHEVQQQQESPANNHDDEIARRAHELWRQKGCPQGSAEQDWFEAAEQLRAMANTRNSRLPGGSGSVQS